MIICGADFCPWWDGPTLVEGQLFVHPDYQKSGIGSALLAHVLRIGLEKYGAETFSTFTYRDPVYPRSWYERLGMTEDRQYLYISGNIRNVLTKLTERFLTEVG